MENPMQPIELDRHGVIRFRGNAIVRALLDAATEGRRMDLNDIARMHFSDEDRRQLAQLIGYSVCGYHELSYVTDAAASAASKAARKVNPKAGGCRDDGCPIHTGMGERP
jgi:hypothetical protein